jgi:hypothetical protein
MINTNVPGCFLKDGTLVCFSISRHLDYGPFAGKFLACLVLLCEMLRLFLDWWSPRDQIDVVPDAYSCHGTSNRKNNHIES